VYAGLLPWNFFNQAVTTSSNSLIGNAALITKVYFPRLVIPGAAVGAGLVDFAIAAVILFVMAFHYGIAFGASILMLIPLALLTTLFAVGVGMWMSALNVKYRDVRYALPFLLQIWMYVTPIIYPVTFIPQRWHWLILLNPLSGIIQGFRSAIFGRPFDWTGIVVSTVVTLSIVVYAAFAFRRMEREFADII
jgi:lipopolysaccharide transport system permease protein